MITRLSKQGGRRFGLGSLGGAATALVQWLRVLGTSVTVVPVGRTATFLTWNVSDTFRSWNVASTVTTWNVSDTFRTTDS